MKTKNKKGDHPSNNTIIGFFKELRTNQLNDYHVRFASISNKNFKIYANNRYEEKRKNMAFFFLNNDVRNIKDLDYMTNLIDKWLLSCLSNFLSIL